MRRGKPTGGLGLAGAAAFVALLAQSAPLVAAEPDRYDFAQFERAKNAFDAGEYREAVARFDALLKRPLKNPALEIEIHKFIAVSYLFVGDRASAEAHFSKLLTMAPEYALDPMVFPIEVVDFFTEIKAKNQKQLEALAVARAREETARKAEEEARRKAEIERLRRNVYLEKRVVERSLLVALVPFGAGQFQNGHTVKGALFLSGELLFAAGAVATYFLHESLRDRASEPFESRSSRREAERLELGYRAANYASLVAFGSLLVAGIIDSLYFYQQESAKWRQIEEREVPETLRPGKPKPGASLRPDLTLGDRAFGLGLRGRF